MSKLLFNQHALITGGSKGIGNAIAKELAALGCKITLLSRNGKLLESEVDKLEKIHAVNHSHIQFDLSQPDLIESALIKSEDFKNINILINCAGLTQTKLLISTPSKEIQDIINVNLVSPIILCKNFIKNCNRQKKAGTIVNISSIVADSEYNLMGSTIYTATKAGLSRFGECVNQEQNLIRQRRPQTPTVTIHTIHPGYVPDTDIGKTVKVDSSDASSSFMLQMQTTKEAVAHDVAVLLT